MTKFRITLKLFWIFILVSCQRNQNVEIRKDSEPQVIKKMIINSYQELDSQYFDERDNCFFLDYIRRDSILNNGFFDRNVNGTGIKYFESPFHDYSFSILRDQNGRYYYFGKSEMGQLKRFLLTEFQKLDSGYISSDYNLHILPLDTMQSAVLEEYINENLLYDDQGVLDVNAIFNHMDALLYNLFNQRSSFNALIYYPQLEPLTGVALNNFLEKMKRGRPLSKKEKNIIESFDKDSYFYLDHRTLIYKYDNLGDIGVLMCEISVKNESLKLNMKFIPNYFYNFRMKFEIFYPKDAECE